MVSLNSRAGLRRALEPGHVPFSVAYSLPQFTISHTPEIAPQMASPTSLEATPEEPVQDNKGLVCVDNACWV
jgi:hypothetical protein